MSIDLHSAIAINLGNSFSTVAQWDSNNEIHIFNSPYNDSIYIPSTICYKEDGSILVGSRLQSIKNENSNTFIYDVKRMIGCR